MHINEGQSYKLSVQMLNILSRAHRKQWEKKAVNFPHIAASSSPHLIHRKVIGYLLHLTCKHGFDVF